MSARTTLLLLVSVAVMTVLLLLFSCGGLGDWESGALLNQPVMRSWLSFDGESGERAIHECGAGDAQVLYCMYACMFVCMYCVYVLYSIG